MTARMDDEEFEDWCTNVNDDAGNVSLPLIAEARRARASEAAALDALETYLRLRNLKSAPDSSYLSDSLAALGSDAESLLKQAGRR